MERDIPQRKDNTTIDFLKEAHQSGAIERYKARPRKNTALNLNIVGLYWGTYLEQTDIALQLGVSRQAVSQSIRFTIKNIWKASSIRVRAQYPINALSTKKSHQSTIEQFTKTDKATQVSTMLKAGFKKDEVAQQLGLREEFVQYFISSTAVPIDTNLVKKREKIREIRESIKRIILESEDASLVQTAFDMQTLGMANKLVESNSNQVVPLGSIFKTRPSRKFPDLAQELINNSLPVMRIMRGHTKKGNYPVINYYIRTRDVEKIKRYLSEKSDHNPNHSNIEIYCGLIYKLPKTTDLVRGYKRVFTGVARNILHPRLREKGFNAGLFLHDCPVTILRYHKSYYVHPKDYEKLQEFLRAKLEKYELR